MYRYAFSTMNKVVILAFRDYSIFQRDRHTKATQYKVKHAKTRCGLTELFRVNDSFCL